MTEIEIRDPDSTEPDAAGAAAATPGAAGEPAPDSPYRNLLVPLVVVPALIVMVLVLVFVLFGAIAGHEDSPRENLDRLLHGGKNERQQAAFSLVRQVLDYRRAVLEGRAPEWDIDESFLPELRAARDQIGELESEQDVLFPLVLSSVMAQLGDPEGVSQLAELTALSERLDPERRHSMDAAWTLAAIGPELEERERVLAADALIALLESEDPGLVLVAIAGLQNLPSERTIPALKGMLGSRVLEQRGSAALSLAALGDAAGEPVLREMLALGPYEAERDRDPSKWPPQRVSESRRKALAALAELGVPFGDVELEGWAEEDPDPLVREAARALRKRAERE